jgi:hypothetical protein
MAVQYSIQDIAGICLVAADGNVDRTLKHIVQRVERFQTENNRRFGESSANFLNLFRGLTTVELGIKDTKKDITRYYNDPYFGLDDVSLKQVMRPMLSFRQVLFSDDDAHWIQKDDARTMNPEGNGGVSVLSGELVMELEDMFNKPADCLTRRDIKKFMKRTQINRKLLFHCSHQAEDTDPEVKAR